MPITENEAAKIKLLAFSQKQKFGSWDTGKLRLENPELQHIPYEEVFRAVHNIKSSRPQAIVNYVYRRVPHLKSLRESGTKLAKTISDIHTLCRLCETHMVNRPRNKKRIRDLKKKYTAAQARP